MELTTGSIVIQKKDKSFWYTVTYWTLTTFWLKDNMSA